MAFGCRHRPGKVLANEGGRESRPGCKETSIDGLCPGFDNGAEAGRVEIDDYIRQRFHGMDAVDERKADAGRRFDGTYA